jgi:hypothetical protein
VVEDVADCTVAAAQDAGKVAQAATPRTSMRVDVTARHTTDVLRRTDGRSAPESGAFRGSAGPALSAAGAAATGGRGGGPYEAHGAGGRAAARPPAQQVLYA